MKTNILQFKATGIQLLISIVLILVSFSLNAQNKAGKEKAGKQKYSIHILKEVNGDKTTIDTTFETSDDFDVKAWVDKHNDEMDNHLKKIDKEINVTIPNFTDRDMKAMPDTIIVNGDTVIVKTELKKIMEENPAFGELGMKNFFNEQFEAPENPDDNIPQSSPCPGMKGNFPPMPPMNGFNFPGLEQLLPLGNLEQIVIKKKRHGKKIIINFEDNDNDIVIRPGYFNDEERSVMRHPKERKVIIKKNNVPDDAIEENSNVEHYKDGNKEIFIIRKK